jgi:glycosyltransferase involved in cell wall biosynthesis
MLGRAVSEAIEVSTRGSPKEFGSIVPTTGVWAADSRQLFKPPLVSLVLINWNYAAYVGEAIRSIENQDYPNLEILVVDNGSTDASRSVIADCVGDNGRARIIHLEKNLGQLGAFLDVFSQIKGDFLTVVDADDVLCPNFVSSHLQVHLALPRSIAFTSSNVVEMAADGCTLTGGYAGFGTTREPLNRGLRPIDAALRLPTISEADYLRLDQSTCTYSGASRWIWGPGSSNVYRRSVLALVHQPPKQRSYFRAVDSYLNPLCQILGGSALIDRHLSAYRIHDANYFAARESVHGLKKGRLRIMKRLNQERRELIHFLFQRPELFRALLSSRRFWDAVYQLAEGLGPSNRKLVSDPAYLQLFIDNFARLRLAFGEAFLLTGLSRLLLSRDLRTVIRGAYGGRIPTYLRLELWKQRGGPIRACLAWILSKALKRMPRWWRGASHQRPRLASDAALPQPQLGQSSAS